MSERFAELAAAIPQVKAVLLDLSGEVPQVITYMSPRDIEARTRVYDAERAVSSDPAMPAVDFRVISLDTISPERIDRVGPRTRHLLRRD